MGKRYDDVMENIEKKNANWELEKRVEILEKKISQMECPHKESVFNKERTVAGDFFPFVISYTETCASCGKELKRYFSEWEWLKAKAAVLNKEVDQKCKEKK